jgi:hypothetical protein
MSEFKVGDKVRCINSNGTSTLLLGHIYMVCDVWSPDGENQQIKIHDVGQYYLGHFRFELATDTPTKHKHHDLICKWAAGYEIEMYLKSTNSWVCISDPSWWPDTEYRIKPMPTTKIVTTFVGYSTSPNDYHRDYHVWNSNGSDVSKDNLRLEFCIETGNLLSATVIGH